MIPLLDSINKSDGLCSRTKRVVSKNACVHSGLNASRASRGRTASWADARREFATVFPGTRLIRCIACLHQRVCTQVASETSTLSTTVHGTAVCTLRQVTVRGDQVCFPGVCVGDERMEFHFVSDRRFPSFANEAFVGGKKTIVKISVPLGKMALDSLTPLRHVIAYALSSPSAFPSIRQRLHNKYHTLVWACL